MVCHVRRAILRVSGKSSLIRFAADMAGHVPTTGFSNKFFEVRVMQTLPNPSRLHRLVSWAKTPASAAQSTALLLLLSAGATAAWMPPQARHALARRALVAVHLPALPALFHAAPPAEKRAVASLPPLLSRTVRTESNAQTKATLSVTSTGDGDVDPTAPPGTCITTSANGANCTLRAAIEVADVNGGATINFAIPGGGVQTITPATQLPNITVPVTINGYTQSGASANTNALLKGDNAVILVAINETKTTASNSFVGAGLQLGAGSDGSTISGLAIGGVPGGVGIIISNSNKNTIAGCFIGADATGTKAVPNALNGVGIANSSSNNTIGGLLSARNLISGNGSPQPACSSKKARRDWAATLAPSPERRRRATSF